MDPVVEHRGYAPDRLDFAVLTASDSRGQADDASGNLISEMVQQAGHRMVSRSITRDDAQEIRLAVKAAIESCGADVVVVNGGTGFSPRDVTVDAVLPLFDREVAGFGELFRALSYEQVGAAAMLSRATAGVVEASVVFIVPGSPKAVELAMTSLVLPEVAHLIGQVRR